MKTLAVSQSNYIPWKGYFDLINFADQFILYDDVQYTKNDWRNRNLIKTDCGTSWLTIPVLKKKLSQKIQDTTTANNTWRIKHWRSLCQYYGKARYFKLYAPAIETLYSDMDSHEISTINYQFISTICRFLNINTKIEFSHKFKLPRGKTERLVDLCQQTDSQIYLSGPAAKVYLDVRLFKEKGIDVRFMDYSDYPEYRQLYPPFVHQVSVLDLIFNEGPNAHKYMKSF